MNNEQLERIRVGQGFIAALDQSGGSTPQALLRYGIQESGYSNEEEMYKLVHDMRTRIITCPVFDSKYILGAILFENTMNRTIDGLYTADYLWEKKGIVPFLKIDEGLAGLENGVQLMKPMAGLDERLAQAVDKNIFGTKMRSVIKEANSAGIRSLVEQQFDLAKRIFAAGLVPIVEPEVDINSTDKVESESLLKEMILEQLSRLESNVKIMLKLTIPSVDNFYEDLMGNPHVVRVVALSGGYEMEDANARLARNRGLIASFSRALAEGLTSEQTDSQFEERLGDTIQSIFQASIT
ncbi:fructose bisphosphate aldolase [Cohnella phaseoli]|uniref:fructose-bisphosphate aldolase n=1 Tax=Cohnella phaseoli TaxID=456490 RepID=A0A3D9JLV9_9BACL|nr:fructose bisphosphate aldolase [Cohnella phaseoli]RED75038.1 fructose-bisphosphate aldolase [Cohnella phaseoli]